MNKVLPLLLFFFLTCNKILFASHAMGGELTYICLGQGPTSGSLSYEVTFTFYRDCAGITPANPLLLQVTNSCGFPSLADSLFLDHVNPISPLCPSAVSTCNGGAYLGIEEWIYIDTIVVPGYCSDWTFSHSEASRNNAITTVPNASNFDLFVYCTINNLNGICNNSPRFFNNPVPLCCSGQQFCFDQGAYDTEGDSLTYQFINPRTGPTAADTLSYSPGYSPTQPVIGFSPTTLNLHTGEFCISPSQQDVTPIAILVNEYRDGVLIGQVERDMQMIIVQCNNNLPIVTGFNLSTSFSADICVNQQNCFSIISIDPDSANTTSITWDNAIPNATLTTFGGHRDSAVFCWSPTLADTSVNPYCFKITVSDDNCPYLGIQIFEYCVTVDPSPTCHSVSFVPVENKKIAWKIFPQPATDNFTIDFGNEFNPQENYNIRIDNILGEIVYQSPIREKKISIDIGQWPSSGIHFVYLVDENKRIVKAEKIITIK